MTDLNKLLIGVAIASAKDHILWEVNNSQDSWDTPESLKEYANIQAESKAAIDAYAAAGGLVTNRRVTGFHPTLDHYMIDDAVTKKFGKGRVCADSEGGQFYAYTDASVVGEMEEYLKSQFPDLEYGVYDDNDSPRPIQLINWHSSELILCDAGVEVDYKPVITAPVQTGDELNQTLDDIVQGFVKTGKITSEEAEGLVVKYREVS